MYLVEILLPVADNRGRPFHHGAFDSLRETLTQKFGGLTSFSRSPAEGYWRPDDQSTHVEDVIVFEVMTDGLDKEWWRALREGLERAFEQTQVVIRSHAIERL
jgi:hypothetical protein